MSKLNKHILLNSKGFTLIELLLVIPLMVIVLTLGYNMFFLTQTGFKYVNHSFDVSEELRIFQMNIYSEANEAMKAESDSNKGALHRISETEIYIYTDVSNSDGIPELVRYYKSGNDILREVKLTTDTDGVFPYSYPDSSSGTAKTVLSNVDSLVFDEPELINEPENSIDEEKDNRMKLHMNIRIKAEPKPIAIEGYLVSKSKAEAE